MAPKVALTLNTDPNADSKVALISSWPTAFVTWVSTVVDRANWLRNILNPHCFDFPFTW